MSDDAALKELFKRAAEIAQGVPEQLRQDAFNRALDSLLGTADGHAPRRRRSGTAAPSSRPARGHSKSDSSPVTARPKRGGSSRPGPKTAVLDLKANGFFSAKRTIADIRDYLEKKRGHKFTLQDLSPTLLSLVRTKELDRDRNANGQYEYKAP